MKSLQMGETTDSGLNHQIVEELDELKVTNSNSFETRFVTESLKKVILKIWLIFFMKQTVRDIRIQESNQIIFNFQSFCTK
jgi:hypothetical protein